MMKRLLIILLLLALPAYGANWIIGGGVTSTIDGPDLIPYVESSTGGGLKAISKDDFATAIGGVGPQGPQGEPGPPGADGAPGDPASNIITSVNAQTGDVVLDAADVGALPSTTTTVAALLQYGYVFSFRSDSPACDTGHVDYTTVNAWLAARGINDSNIICHNGFVPLAPGATVTISGVSGTGAIGTMEIATGGLVGLSGISGTGEIGTIDATLSSSNATAGLSGLSGTGEIGALDIMAGSGVGLSGVEGTGTLASIGVVVQTNGTVTLSGVAGTGALGTVSPQVATTQAFTEPFTANIGSFSVLAGTPTWTSGRMAMNLDGEGIYKVNGLVRGFSVAFDVQLTAVSGIDTYNVLFLDVISGGDSYSLSFGESIDGEAVYGTSVDFYKNGELLDSVASTANYWQTERAITVRFETGGNIVVKQGGTTLATFTDAAYSTFTELRFKNGQDGNSWIAYVDDVAVAAL